MSKSRAQELIDLGNRLFSRKTRLDQLNQEIAEQIFPQRADFTTRLDIGDDANEHLDDSYPVLMHRELSASLSAMLRPNDKKWSRATTLDDRIDSDEENARYLEYVDGRMRRAMYDARTKFIRATKEGDADYTAFGQCVISVEEAPNRDHLYYRTHHLRDCAWLENEIGDVDHLHRKDAMTARKLRRVFGDKKLHASIKTACEQEPGKEFPVRVIVLPSDEYDYTGSDAKGKVGAGRKQAVRKLPFIACYVDVDNLKVLKEAPLADFLYVVPRWQTLSGSQYAFSPAARTALPDARMAQQLARILLEAGEKMVDPPMIATEEAVKEINIGAGMVSWLDYAYDEKLGEALRPMRIEGDMRTGFAMRQDLRDLLAKAFFIDKLSLPEAGKDMTAYEVARRLEEHVRNLLPLFEPIEVEYNTRLLDKTFALMMNMGAFDVESMPDALSARDITWAFESPIQQASQRLLAEQGMETVKTVGELLQGGALQASPVHFDRIGRDIVRGIGGPATWRKTAAEQGDEAAAAKAKAAMQGLIADIAQGADVAAKVGEGMQSLQAAGQLPPPGARRALPRPNAQAAQEMAAQQTAGQDMAVAA